jgi:hypothetical protein
MAEMIKHEGRRYRREDAIKAGILSQQVDVVVETEDEPVTVSSEVVDGTVDREPTAEKVEDPAVTKVREPSTTKRRGAGTK